MNPSINRSDYKATGCRRGGKGDIYVYVQLLQQDRRSALLPAGPGGQTVSEGMCSPSGGPHGGRAVAGVSQRLAVVSLGGSWGGRGVVWFCPGGLTCLSWCHLWNRDSQPAASSAQEGGQTLMEEKALQVNKAKTSRVLPEPTWAHVYEERWGKGTEEGHQVRGGHTSW